jgi:hypothetical protein
VTSQKIFPSRLSLNAGDGFDEKGTGVKHLVNIFRRLHRIFAHAWFQHRGVFWAVEGQTGLYVLFKTVCDMYDLLPAENYKLPPEAEGLEPAPEKEKKPAPTILKPESNTNAFSNLAPPGAQEDPGNQSVGRTNTRRHIRSSPSTGAAVAPVPEEHEEESDVSKGLRELSIEEGNRRNTIIEHSAEELEEEEEKEEKESHTEEDDVTVLIDEEEKTDEDAPAAEKEDEAGSEEPKDEDADAAKGQDEEQKDLTPEELKAEAEAEAEAQDQPEEKTDAPAHKVDLDEETAGDAEPGSEKPGEPSAA